MRSDHLSKHIKTHADVKPGEENNLEFDEKEFAEIAESGDTGADMGDMMEYDSDEESGSDVSDSEIAPGPPAQTPVGVTLGPPPSV